MMVGTLAWIAKPPSDNGQPVAIERAVVEDGEGGASFLLFDPGAVTAAPQEPGQTGPIVLQGLSTSRRGFRALVAAGDRAPVWLDLGQSLGEWTLVGPTRDGARFSSADGSLDLKPFSDGAEPQANP
jgi:hypothetical protein